MIDREEIYQRVKARLAATHTCKPPEHIEWMYDYYGHRRGYEKNGKRFVIYCVR